MTVLRCPKCKGTAFEEATVPEHDVTLGGMSFTVRDARLAICKACGHKIADGKEMKRWEEYHRNDLQRRGLLPDPGIVDRLTTRYGLNRADLAAMIGVTRQTLHSWATEPGAIQAAPGPILLQLLEADAAGAVAGVCSYLIGAAKKRGHTLGEPARCSFANRPMLRPRSQACPSFERIPEKAA